MALILCIETSTTNCSVAIGKDNKVVSLIEFDSNRFSHAEQLHVFIKQAVQEAHLKLNDLNAVAISKGPGSYTGLRIGVSTAKGLCYALDIPLISIPTLEVLARQVALEDSKQAIIPMIDARRMEVYTSVFTHDYNTIQNVSAKILDENSYVELFENYNTLYAIGNGVTKFKAVTNSPEKFKFIEQKNPSAKEMVSIAEGKYIDQDVEDVAYFEPFYLKDFVANR